MNTLVLLGLGSLAYILSRRTKAAENVLFQIQPPNLQSFQIKENNGQLYFLFQLPIIFDNASPQNFAFKDLYLRVEHDGALVGNASLSGTTTIPARHNITAFATVRFPLTVQAKDLIAELVASGSALLRYVGTVTSEGANLYIDRQETLEIPDSVKSFLQTAFGTVASIDLAPKKTAVKTAVSIQKAVGNTSFSETGFQSYVENLSKEQVKNLNIYLKYMLATIKKTKTSITKDQAKKALQALGNSNIQYLQNQTLVGS